VKLTLEHGRPGDTTGRLDKEIRVYDVLDQLKIAYDRTDHGPLNTMEACHEVDELFQTPMVKNLFLCNRQKTKFYLLLMPGEKPFKTKEISAQINSARRSFGGPEDMEELLNLTPGSVTIMGLLFDPDKRVQLLVDEDVLPQEYLGCHPAINTSSIRVRTEDIFGRFLAYTEHEMTVVKLLGE